MANQSRNNFDRTQGSQTLPKCIDTDENSIFDEAYIRSGTRYESSAPSYDETEEYELLGLSSTHNYEVLQPERQPGREHATGIHTCTCMYMKEVF